MSGHRLQAHIDSPLSTVWSLVGSPERYPEWWPRVIEVDGERFEEGDEFAQVTRDPMASDVRSNFLIERRDDMREIRMSCQLSGYYAHWLLTAAQGGTFVELEMGIESRRLRQRLFNRTLAPRYFRRWSEESIAGLKAVARQSAGAGAQTETSRP
ncbi:MAG TPA: SRPBCC family protein [Thermoleophilaceae bacterium]|nr:SRPBCC family protein [Thermoleophilaceae bacterium]